MSKRFIGSIIIVLFVLTINNLLLIASDDFSFAITADMRKYSGKGKYDNDEYFAGVVKAIKRFSKTAFMISPGDIDPPSKVYWTIKKYMGENYLWFPVIGNHEAETKSDMEWLLNYHIDKNGKIPPNIVRWGPENCKKTTYSFDYKNTHFIALNEYCEGYNKLKNSGGNIDKELFEWLEKDLNKTNKKNIFVMGHSPAYPMPDYESVRIRHEKSSLGNHPKNRTKFWRLLKKRNVIAYICGHTHNYSITDIAGVWQIDAGHSRGIGDMGSKSTFIIIDIQGKNIFYKTYRLDKNKRYKLSFKGKLR